MTANPIPAISPPNRAPVTYPIPATTVSMSSERLTMMAKLSPETDPMALDIRMPPRPAIPEEIMKTLSLSRTRLCPSMAEPAGLSFIAASRRP